MPASPSASPSASLTFLPWVRQGVAAAMPDWPESAAKPFQDALAAIVNAPDRPKRLIRTPTRCWRRR